MLIGFIIWSACALVTLGIGVHSWRSAKPAGFFSGVEPPKVTDVTGYNHAVGLLWLGYGLLFEALYLPLLFLPESTTAAWLLLTLGTCLLTVALPVIYSTVILRRYAVKSDAA